MTFYVIYNASGAIVGFGLVCNPADVAGTQKALAAGVSLLVVTQATYQQVAASPAAWKVAGGAVVAA